MTKSLALTAVGIQLTLGAILVVLLLSLQQHPTPTVAPLGEQPIHVVIDQPHPCRPANGVGYYMPDGKPCVQ